MKGSKGMHDEPTSDEFQQACNSERVMHSLRSTIANFLAVVCSQPCHDAFNDWVGNALRQLEGTTFGHDLYSLAAGIAQHMARAALGQMQFEFLTNLWRDLILQIVSELSEEFLACDH
jgi:hypothetical protein